MIKNPSTQNEVFTHINLSTHVNQLNELSTPLPETKKSIQKFSPLIICGPSGTGKTTLLKRLMNDFEDLFGFSISHTTRQPRKGEKDGKDYHFVSREEMELCISEGDFIETAEFSGNLYGTSKKSIADVQNSGKICILDVDIKGVYNLKKTDLKPKCIFIRPPNLIELEERLRKRGTESEEAIKKRLLRAVEEMNIGNCKTTWDYSIINDNLDKAYDELKKFIIEIYTI